MLEKRLRDYMECECKLNYEKITRFRLMNRRCYRCKCLEEESPFKAKERMKKGGERFFCRKCIKKKDVPYEAIKTKTKKKMTLLEESEELKEKRFLTIKEMKRRMQLRKWLGDF